MLEVGTPNVPARDWDVGMPLLLRALALLGLCCFAHTTQAAALRLVADTWPPFTDASLPNGGLATDLVTTALNRAGYGSTFVQVPWARALHGLGEGTYDILINAWYNDERTRIGQFSSEYLLNRVLFLKLKNAPVAYAQLSDLYPYKVAVIRSYAYAPVFDDDASLNKVQVSNFPIAVRMLAAGRVDLAVEDEFVARYFLEQEPEQARENIEFLPKPLSENRLRILISLKNPDHALIAAAFDKAIDAMRADGSYAAIFKAHGM